LQHAVEPHAIAGRCLHEIDEHGASHPSRAARPGRPSRNCKKPFKLWPQKDTEETRKKIRSDSRHSVPFPCFFRVLPWP
jgi:hypothetical protein